MATTTAAAATTAAPVSRTRWDAGRGYRAHLDGLRAVAVYLVLLFHAGVHHATGGFIGVDIFFVLSGYLVTQLLLRDVDAQGSIGFRRFYARRFRRLLPASFVALVVTAVVFTAIAAPAEVGSAANAFKASFLYVANWFFIHRSADYFAADINTNPVLHFWSLAVEEQFYLLWPILLGGLVVATRRFGTNQRRAVQIAIATAAGVSAIAALVVARHNVNRAYYGTDTRAYQLLAGALLATTPGLLRRARRTRVAVPGGLVALGMLFVLASSVVDVSPVQRGIATTIAAVVLVAAIETAPSAPVSRGLAASPAVYLGQISYGTYLWHWPVMVVAQHVVPGIRPWSTFAVAAFVATGLASLSYHLLERPVRRSPQLDHVPRAVIACGLAVGVVSAVAVVPRLLDASRATARTATAPPAATRGFTPVPNLDLARVRNSAGPDLHGVKLVWNCIGMPPSACTVVRGSGPHVLVFGDSHAQMFFPTFARMAQLQHFTLSMSYSPGCPWQRDVELAVEDAAGDRARCLAFKRDLYQRVIPALHPDVVVAIANDYVNRRPGHVLGHDGAPLPARDEAQLVSLVRRDSDDSVAALRRVADKVVLFEPVPTALQTDDPFVCLSKAKVLEECRFVARASALHDVYPRLADNRHVFAVNIDRLLCPFMPICDPVIDGLVVRFDNQHIAPRFAVSLAAPLGALLQADGVLPASRR